MIFKYNMFQKKEKRNFFKKFSNSKNLRNKYRVNYKIRSRNVLTIIDKTNKNLGILKTSDALKLSKKMKLDLVEISSKSNPPVCKILNFGKFIYNEGKKKKKGIGQNKISRMKKMKEIKIGVNIDENDYQTKLRKSIDFLKKKYKLKILITFRGREMHQLVKKGFFTIFKVIEDLKEFGKVSKKPQKMGRNLYVLISPH
jgi:translation initiation factor IF-3